MARTAAASRHGNKSPCIIVCVCYAKELRVHFCQFTCTFCNVIVNELSFIFYFSKHLFARFSFSLIGQWIMAVIKVSSSHFQENTFSPFFFYFFFYYYPTYSIQSIVSIENTQQVNDFVYLTEKNKWTLRIFCEIRLGKCKPYCYIHYNLIILIVSRHYSERCICVDGCAIKILATLQIAIA